MKKCSKCGQEKPLTEFNKQSRNQDGLNTQCSTCTRSAGLAYYYANRQKTNPERNEARRLSKSHRQHTLLKKYGITREGYDALLDEQNGVCAICEHPEKQKDVRYGTPLFLAVDHDHNTNKVRGLLCSACNVAIGKMDDDPGRLRKAAEYLERQSPPDEPGG